MTDYLKHGSEFTRNLSEADSFTYLGTGSPGGKGAGLINIKAFLEETYPGNDCSGIKVDIPPMVVILTGVYDSFIKQNKLDIEELSSRSDEQIALVFQKASFPVSIIGDLRAFSVDNNRPLAIRSSSLMEDSLEKPFAGVFATKMIPNNNLNPDIRFSELLNAVKYVYSSAWFKAPRDSFRAEGLDIKEEKMAVIIQDIQGLTHGDYFYPSFSGVGRSFNYYPFGESDAEDGVVDLALGLGKTIVDGGKKWFYCPSAPGVPPPASLKNMLDMGQTRFWAVNLHPPEKTNPLDEAEFMTCLPSSVSEKNGILRNLCSTYSAESDRLEMGIPGPGFRLIDFSPILKGDIFPFNSFIADLLKKCRDRLKQDVEIEFAVNYDPANKITPDFGFLQIRPMKVSTSTVDYDFNSNDREASVIYSESTLGNGFIKNIRDFVYIPPEKFTVTRTPEMAAEIEKINNDFLKKGKNYVLAGFGRWGSSDSSLGIPVIWSQISAARSIVESTLPEMNPTLSQGSHFFHNILNLGVIYMSVDELNAGDAGFINYQKLAEADIVYEGAFFVHLKFKNNIEIVVDGRKHKGIITV